MVASPHVQEQNADLYFFFFFFNTMSLWRHTPDYIEGFYTLRMLRRSCSETIKADRPTLSASEVSYVDKVRVFVVSDHF
jgi:hypothetical protein